MVQQFVVPLQAATTKTIMKTTMYQDLRNEAQANKNMTFGQTLELADKYTDLIVNTDDSMIGVGKHLTGYGTWKVRIDFANEYHFGQRIADLLTKDVPSIITHDEDKEFTFKDFEEDIQEKLVALIEELNDEDNDEE